MLRWCLSTVRALGGYVGTSQCTRPSSTCSALACQLALRPAAICRRPLNAAPSPGDPACSHIERRRANDPVAQTYARSSIYASANISQGECDPSVQGAHMSPGDGDQANAAQSIASDARDLHILRAFLSPENMFSRCPQLHTANTLRSLYMSVKARNQVAQLSSAMLSSLISLFGSLSLDPSRPCVYTNSFVSHMRRNAPARGYWLFVVSIAGDKEQSGMMLSPSDRYWLMRAGIATIEGVAKDEPSESNSRLLSQSIVRTHKHYRYIRGHTGDPEVHVPYLEALLSTNDPIHLATAAHALSHFLRSHRSCHPRLLETLCRILCQDRRGLSDKSQHELLNAVWFRVSKLREDNQQLRLVGKDDGHCTAPTGISRAAVQSSATYLGDIIRDTLFAAVPPETDSRVYRWAHAQLRSTFSPDRPFEDRWRHLLLIALFYCPATAFTAQCALEWESTTSRGNAGMLWEVVFGFATLERALKDNASPLPEESALRESMRNTAWALLGVWRASTKDESLPPFVTRALLASLIRIASATDDPSLFDTCRSRWHSERLWQFSKGDDLTRSQTVQITAQFLVAQIRVGNVPNYSIISALAAICPEASWQSDVISTVVTDLVDTDLDLATSLAALTRQTGGDISPEAAHGVATALAGRGYIHRAVLYLNDPRFSPLQVEALLGAIARSLAQHRITRLAPEASRTLGNALYGLCRLSLPLHSSRCHVQHLIVLLCQSSRASQAVAIIRTVVRASPAYFQQSFLPRCFRALLKRKRIRHVAQLLELVDTMGKNRAATWRGQVVKGLATVKVSGLARQARRRILCSQYGRRKPISVARTALRSSISPTVLSLKISSTMMKPLPDPSALRFALQAHVHAGRAYAARKLFERFAAACDVRLRTSLGNSLLHAILLKPSPRNGRQMRKVLALLSCLIKNHAFAPDRVTINILLKATMRWRAMFDHRKLRALFDHMIRSGYPGGSYSIGRPPFGTPLPHPARSLALPKVPPFISFERHARPMYKMFIKAFYLRHDVEGARTVIEIMKVEQRAAARASGERSQARRGGRSKVDTGVITGGRKHTA
ncbi:hypothetical protein BV22DRAFT_1099124 [Leucogyrophana mollusca]|uniref:Uncharacterized protein n=1 Tax=Leucogyrophana mollusca TaxID=85980 RepID=A0ACB8B232_9AGAM|nr:hypothetical protein BV22DRAFT_1099124 [Leucogyrophana mollusca]